MKKDVDQAWFDEMWFSELPAQMKLAWFYVWTKSDLVGVWTANKKLADYQLGHSIKWDDFLSEVGDRIRVLPSGKWWITGYCRFQFGQFSPESRVHVAAKRKLNEHGISDSDTLWIPYPYATDSIRVRSGSGHCMEKGEEVQEKRVQHMEGFDSFWEAYPKKKAKGDAEKAWNASGCSKLTDSILSAVSKAKKSEDWKREKGRFIPHPATWIRAKGWEDGDLATKPHREKKSEDIDLINIGPIPGWAERIEEGKRERERTEHELEEVPQ